MEGKEGGRRRGGGEAEMAGRCRLVCLFVLCLSGCVCMFVKSFP